MKKAKKERKYTLSGQMTAIFIGLLVFILMTVFIVNTGFLGRYYMSHKQKDLIEMYEAMSEAVNNGNLGNEAVQKKLVAELEKTNIDVLAMRNHCFTHSLSIIFQKFLSLGADILRRLPS